MLAVGEPKVTAAAKGILIVEDEVDLADLLSFNLQREGYVCRRSNDGAAALAELQRFTPDLLILDRMLPGKSGDEIVRDLRRDPRTAAIPVLMLTAKAEEADALVGFALGADDYVTKPFSMKLLLARVAAIFRRSAGREPEPEVLSIGPVRMDGGRREVFVDGSQVTLTATEFGLLRTLMKADGRVMERGQLINAVLGPMVAVTDRTIDVHIAAVRKKLGSAAAWVQTVRGVGYTFRLPVD